MKRPNPEPRTIVQAADPARAIYSMRIHFDEARAGVSLAVGDEDGASVRALSIQVVDRLRVPWKRRWLLRVWTSTAAGGAVSGGTMTVSTGTLIQSRSLDQDVDVMTDENGLAVIDLQTAGAVSRYLFGVVIGEVLASDAIEFA